MILGVTGTRYGMTTSQEHELRALWKRLAPTMLLHGDCVGVDDACHNLAAEHGCSIIIHGPIERALCAECTSPLVVERKPLKSHLARNRDIVDGSDIMIAIPFDETEQARGGTWYTVSYMRKKSKPLYLILPSGTVVEERLCLP